ncbi:SDR family NAD(P)-dependent oxidoreductase [Cytophaga aurantiaca]|uniref:SDR family NAD(P)-dependent oxidoreductase n=1 Tax=Cytophaga aurantiaca TaxID=29530 RepID=UPI000361ED0E|nr:SDR family NAD(P)-dependent oxidoreductase [Cytophaga aurantiaca]
MTKTIFITGASKGFGKIWTEAFLKRGDNVVATARNTDALSDLVKQYGKQILTLPLNVNDREASFTAIKKAKEHFGRLDVVINNAGYGLFGAVEEASEKEARDQIETNVFGLLWITQAALPIMREQGKGHIIQISSALGVVTLPALGLYNATKWAIEGLSESLAAEVKGFGIDVTIVEPNGYSTDFGSGSATHTTAIPAYDPVKAALYAGFTEDSTGLPEATAEAMLKLTAVENPPLRLFLGKVGLPWVKQVYAERMAVWESWKEVSEKAQGK